MTAARHTPAHPWRPMTDAEWAALSALLLPPRRTTPGRPPAPRRDAWDAIFWVACSSGPWSALPAGLGRADTAHRALRRAAAGGRLGLLLFALARRALPALDSLEWRIVRAYRRMFRVMPGTAITLARRLGLLSALPCHPAQLPRPGLAPLLLTAFRAILPRPAPLHPADGHLFRALHRLVGGEMRRWRTTD